MKKYALVKTQMTLETVEVIPCTKILRISTSLKDIETLFKECVSTDLNKILDSKEDICWDGIDLFDEEAVFTAGLHDPKERKDYIDALTKQGSVSWTYIDDGAAAATVVAAYQIVTVNE